MAARSRIRLETNRAWFCLRGRASLAALGSSPAMRNEHASRLISVARVVCDGARGTLTSSCVQNIVSNQQTACRGLEHLRSCSRAGTLVKAFAACRVFATSLLNAVTPLTACKMSKRTTASPRCAALVVGQARLTCLEDTAVLSFARITKQRMATRRVKSDIAGRVPGRFLARRLPRAGRAPLSIAGFPALCFITRTKPSTHLTPRSSKATRVRVRKARMVASRAHTGARGDLVQQLASLASEVLGTAISADAALMAAGLDSIGATELSTRMSSRLETELPQTLLFDHPSLRSIVASLRLDDDDDASPSAAPDLEMDEAPAPRAEAQRPREITQGASVIIEMVSAVVFETAGTSLAADTPLMSAGLDSIAATALATTLAQRVDAELPQTLLFDHPTTGAVASFVAAIAPAVEQREARGESEP